MSRNFVETQRFRSGWIYFAIVLVAGVVVWGIVQQVILGVPFGNNPAPDWVVLLMGLIPIALAWMLLGSKLSTRIDQNGIHYKFSPFINRWKVKNWSEIKDATLITYHPLRDYGGWGLRWGRKGKALNVAGNRGLSVQLKNGKKFMLGTQKAEEMQQFLSEIQN